MSLRLADRDIHAFHVLRDDPDCHLSIVCFHAQQALEKSFKAVLFSRRIVFTRTHNLTELASLLRRNGIDIPLADDELLRLNPFAVVFRYDDLDIDLVGRDEATDWVGKVREWADANVAAAPDQCEAE